MSMIKKIDAKVFILEYDVNTMVNIYLKTTMEGVN